MKGDSLEICLTVNGQDVSVSTSSTTSLLTLLRDTLRFTDTKLACGVGECGACTVLVDERPMLACVVPAWRAAGTEVTTARGVAEREGGALLHSFAATAAVQCGFCTPGQYVRAFALLQAGAPSDLCSALSGNICRCTGYQSIVRAVKEVRLRNLADEPGCSGKDVADMSWSEAGGGDLWN